MMVAPIIEEEKHKENALLINPKLYDFNNNELAFKHEDAENKRTLFKYGPDSGYDLEVIADADTKVVS
jgi:hypothetical protein